MVVVVVMIVVVVVVVVRVGIISKPSNLVCVVRSHFMMGLLLLCGRLF